MSVSSSVDVAGRRRSPATFSEFNLGLPPGNKGMRYPADPPRVEEIVAVMREAGDGISGDRIRGLIVVLWRAGLRIAEALDLREVDLEPDRGALLVREGKGGRRREVGMDDWGLGATAAMACPAQLNADRAALLRDRRADAREAVGRTGGADSAAPPCR